MQGAIDLGSKGPRGQKTWGEKARSPFQSELAILQNAINNWHTHRDNFSDLHTKTLSQTDVSCSDVLYVTIAKYVPFQRHFYNNKKKRADLLYYVEFRRYQQLLS